MPSLLTNRQRVLQAASIVMAAIMLSRVLGIVRDAAINAQYDALSVEANAYAIASRFPQLIFTVIAGGALGSAFIPTFSGFLARQEEADAWRLFATVVNLVLVTIMVVTLVTALLAEPLLRFFYPDLATIPGFLPLTARLMRVMLLSAIVFGASGVVMATLNARQHFLLPALAGSVYNLGIIAGALLSADNVMFLAYGVVLGATGHLMLQLPALRKHGARYSFAFSLKTPGVRRVLQLMAPRVLGLSFSEITHVLTQFLAQALLLGSIRALDLAWKVMSMPLGFLGQALGIAAFPTFAILAAQGNLGEMRRILADTLRLILFLGLPATVLLAVLRQPIVTLLFEYGKAGSTSTRFVAWALLFYAVGLVALALIEVVARAFFALGDTTTPVVIGAVQLALMAGLGVLLSRVIFPAMGLLPFGGLALGHSLANLVEIALLIWLLRRKMGGIDGPHLRRGALKMMLAAIVMGAATWLIYWLARPSGPFLSVIASGFAGAVAYVSASWLLRLEELYLLLRPVRRYLRQGQDS